MPDPREWLVRTEEKGTGHRTFGECSPRSRSFAQPFDLGLYIEELVTSFTPSTFIKCLNSAELY